MSKKLQAVYSRMQSWIADVLKDHQEYNEFLDPFLLVNNVSIFLLAFKKEPEVQPLIMAMKGADEDLQNAEANKLIYTLYEKHDVDPDKFKKESARIIKYLKLFAFEC